MTEITYADVLLIFEALEHERKLLLGQARSRGLIGPRWAGHRKSLREKASRAGLLALEIRRAGHTITIRNRNEER